MTFSTAKAELLALAGSRTCCISYSELVTTDGTTHVNIDMRVGDEFATLHQTYEAALAELRVRLGAGVQDQQPQVEPQVVVCDHTAKGRVE